jgi:L-aspartate oxidase
MQRYHPLLELAPRDVVARAITREGFGDAPGQQLPVYLDMRHVTGIDLAKRFPGISAFLARHGLHLAADLIPVRPAAHYLMGGVKTDLDGRTSLPRLYAAGEVACTGVHGANRLASNSLLEGLVFGARAAESMRQAVRAPRGPANISVHYAAQPLEDIAARIKRLQENMWLDAGLLRDAAGLQSMRLDLENTSEQLAPAAQRESIELANLHTVAELIGQSALKREESRGAHYRNDFPQRDDARFALHSITRGRQVSFASSEPVSLVQ